MINFVAQRDSGVLLTKEYKGYGQILKISYDGFENIVRIEPEDPVFGVQILYTSGYPLTLVPPRFLVGAKDIVMKNIKDAELFCKEFEERRQEFFS